MVNKIVVFLGKYLFIVVLILSGVAVRWYSFYVFGDIKISCCLSERVVEKIIPAIPGALFSAAFVYLFYPLLMYMFPKKHAKN